MNIQTYILSFFLFLGIPSVVLANHGPGTTGGGASTVSGETIKANEFVFSIDENYTNYESISREEIVERGASAGGFDALSDSFTTSATLSYGITNDFQVDASIGWYSGRNFVQSHGEGSEENSTLVRTSSSPEGEHGGESEQITSVDPEGLTDLLVRGKYRVLRGASGHLSLIGGAVFPTGKDDVRFEDGEKLEPSSQPGSGRYSVLGGFAYSRYLTSQITMDISSVYSYRFERDDFKMGDRFDNGIAIAYRINEDINSFPQFSIFGEINYQYIGKDKEEEGYNNNSGGDLLYLTPGLRVGFNKDLGLMVAPSIPVVSNMNGDQLAPDFRLISSLFMRF